MYRKGRPAVRWLPQAMAVFVFWLVLAMPVRSGDIVWGTVIASMIGLWAVSFVFTPREPALALHRWPAAMLYLLRLPRAILPAAVQLVGVLSRRRLALAPEVFVYRTTLASQAARVALANAITLTPGTHCVELAGNELTIHCLAPSFARSIRSGEVEAGIRRAFEPDDPA